jgi:transposase-like protein
MYAKLVKAPRRQVRRRHAEEFKREVITACLQPGISVAAVALANGLNANLLRRWVKDHRDAQEVEDGAEIGDQDEALRPATLVPVTVSTPEIAPAGEIKIAIHREQALVEVTWPVSQAAICAQWLREILR